MQALSPPRWPWLLAFELRLLWRGFGLRSAFMAAAAVLFVALLHAVGYAVWRGGGPVRAIAAAPAPFALMTVVGVLLMVSSAFGLAVRTLFERADLDLLLSAPVPAVHVFATRALAVAAGTAAPVGLFLLPVANMGPFAGHWGSLAAWPALFALGMASAAVAFAGTFGLVRVLGARRARVAAQLMGAFIGAGFVLAMQVPALLPRPMREALVRAVAPAAGNALLGVDSVLLWPLRAMLGEPVPLVVLVAIASVLFVAAVRAAAAGFTRVAQEAAAIAVPLRSRASSRAPRAFREGLGRIVVRKELLLMARDPMLIGKSLVQVLYLVPLFVVMVRQGRAAESLAAALVVLAATIASTLAWISVSGEEAPDLLRSAPVPLARLRRLKVAGAVLPVVVLVLPFLAWSAAHSPRIALVMTAFVVAAICGSALVQVWGTPLGAGRDLKLRRSQNVLLRILDNVASFGWAGACYATLHGSTWALAGIALGLLGPVAAAISVRLRGE